MDDLWNPEEANELLRGVLVEIEALAEQLSPARAAALLEEFEEDVGHAFLSQDMGAVKVVCELYERQRQAAQGGDGRDHAPLAADAERHHQDEDAVETAMPGLN